MKREMQNPRPETGGPRPDAGGLARISHTPVWEAAGCSGGLRPSHDFSSLSCDAHRAPLQRARERCDLGPEIPAAAPGSGFRFQVSAFKFPLSSFRSPPCSASLRLPSLDQTFDLVPFHNALPRWLSAFSLVEVTLALGIAGFCMVAMLGLIPAGMRNASTATEQTAAIGILGAVVADLRGTPGSSNTSPRYGITVPASGSATGSTNYFSDDGQTNARSQSRYGVESTLTPQNNQMVQARILIYWPAIAASTNARGSVESVTVLDRK
jgi:uncharacterized protein (TIGR02598 family)